MVLRRRCARVFTTIASTTSFRCIVSASLAHHSKYSSVASTSSTTPTAKKKKEKKQFQRRKRKATTETKTELERQKRSEVVDLNLDWGDKVYRGNATEYAGVKVTSKLFWPIPMHALVQLNPELGSVLNVSPPTEEEEAEADKFLSVLKKIPSDEDLMLREFDQVEGEDEVEVTKTKKTTKKEATAKKKKTIRQEEEKGVQIKTKNTFFPASMPYAHLFEDLLLEARQHYSGGTRSEMTKRQLTKSLILLVPRELLENVAEEMGIWIRPSPKQPKRNVDAFRTGQKRLNFLYRLTEHWRKLATNGKDLAIKKGELGALIWSQYLEALKSLRGTNDAKFLADILKDKSINTNDFTSENDDIQIAQIHTGGWAAGSQHRAKEYVDRLTEKVSTSSFSSSFKGEHDKGVSGTTERMDYAEMFTPDELVNILVKARGKDVMAIRVREKCSWADWLILCSGKSPRHISDLAHAVMFEYKKRVAENPTKLSSKVKPYIEGAKVDKTGGGDEEWNAVDCGSCVVHVLSDRARKYYNIEELWANGDEVLHNGEDILTIDTIKVD